MKKAYIYVSVLVGAVLLSLVASTEVAAQDRILRLKQDRTITRETKIDGTKRDGTGIRKIETKREILQQENQETEKKREAQRDSRKERLREIYSSFRHKTNRILNQTDNIIALAEKLGYDTTKLQSYRDNIAYTKEKIRILKEGIHEREIALKDIRSELDEIRKYLRTNVEGLKGEIANFKVYVESLKGQEGEKR